MNPLRPAIPRLPAAFPMPHAPRPGVPDRSLAMRVGVTPDKSSRDRLLAELAEISGAIDTLSAASQSPVAPKVPKIPPTYFFGHGAYFAEENNDLGLAQRFVVPEGTEVIVYAPPGGTISMELLRRIDNGEDVEGVRRYGSGAEIPNYTIIATAEFAERREMDPYEHAIMLDMMSRDERLLFLEGFTESPERKVVLPRDDRAMSELIGPGMGQCHWVTCLLIPGSSGEGLMNTSRGIVERSPDER